MKNILVLLLSFTVSLAVYGQQEELQLKNIYVVLEEVEQAFLKETQNAWGELRELVLELGHEEKNVDEAARLIRIASFTQDVLADWTLEEIQTFTTRNIELAISLINTLEFLASSEEDIISILQSLKKSYRNLLEIKTDIGR